MLVAPVPPNEAERLVDVQALHILDTPPETRFDRLVELACAIFDVPIAYLALIDSDRQWFKARSGVEQSQTTRSVSFCSHTILAAEPLIIPDTTLDKRFADSPLVVNEPFIRFYAGHPLVGPGGKSVGTFCLADHKPRQLNSREIETFRKLAAVAERELNLTDVVLVQRQLLATKNELIETQKQLSSELAEAAQYLYSMLPAPLTGPVTTDWNFVSSSQLGGDLFGYHWRDTGDLIVYLLDVSGHGIGASLFAITLAHLLRSETLPGVDFGRPAQVLNALNQSFPMNDNCDKFTTMWYGVYNRETHKLTYASAGQHPAVMFRLDLQQPRHLGSRNLPIGVEADHQYQEKIITVPRSARIYLFSDGAFDIERSDGRMMTRDELVDIIADAQRRPQGRPQYIFKQICSRQDTSVFRDDYSLLELAFR